MVTLGGEQTRAGWDRNGGVGARRAHHEVHEAHEVGARKDRFVTTGVVPGIRDSGGLLGVVPGIQVGRSRATMNLAIRAALHRR